MGLRKFERIYYDYYIDDGCEIQPKVRIRYDEETQSFAIQAAEGDRVDIYDESWLLDGELADYEEWGPPRPATLDEVIGVLEENRYYVPQRLDGFLFDEPDEGSYWSGRTAGTFHEGEEITADDIRLIAFEVLDEEWAEREIPYRGKFLAWDADDSVIAMFPCDDAAWDLPDEVGDQEEVGEVMPSPDDLSTLAYAVLTKGYEGPLAEDEWAFYAALATKEMAEEWASRWFGDEADYLIREVRK